MKIILFFLCLLASTISQAAVHKLPGMKIDSSIKTTIYVVNGIWNDPSGVQTSTDALIDRLTKNGVDTEKINWKYFYNPTNGWFGNGDVSELRAQAKLSANIPDSFSDKNYYENLGGRYIYYIENIESSGLSEIEKRVITTAKRLYDQIIYEVEIKGRRLVIVPHSQGNFYTEAAYGLLVANRKTVVIDNIRVVGVAAISKRSPSDRYLTIEQDAALFTAQFVNTIAIAGYKPAHPRHRACLKGCNKIKGDDTTTALSEFTGSKVLHEFDAIYLNDGLVDANNQAQPTLPSEISRLISISINELSANDPPSTTESLESAFTSSSTLSAPWSFGWQVSSGVAPIPYASFQPAGSRTDYPTLAIWNKVSGSAGSPAIEVYPWVVKNTGASPVLYSPLAASFPAQSVIVTPGSSGERAVFRWTARTAGTYEINASYELMQGGEVDVHVQRNGVDIFNVDIARQGSQAIMPTQTVTMSVGDTVDFVVGNGGNTQNSDMTRVSASVKSVSGNGVNSGEVTVQANTIPGATVTVPNSVSACTFVSSGSWSAGQFAPPQYQNADGVVGGNSLNLTNFGVPMPAEPNMALVVKRSSTNQFVLLGSSKTIQVSSGETLSFMMNDSTIPLADYTANTGQLTTRWNCQ